MIYLLLLLTFFVLQLVYFRIADKLNIIDKPNQRSSHTSITLRGGGIIFLLAYLIFFVLNGCLYPWFTIGLSMISIISFADDIKPRSSRVRLLFHFVAMLMMFYELGFSQLPWYYTIMAFVFATGIINAYNFMDGINGITGTYSLVVLFLLWVINKYQIEFVNSDMILYLMLGLFVFNFFNFRKKAKCFAGDVGAISIAFSIVFLLGKLILITQNFSYVVLLAVYGVDSIFTIIHRLILRENIFEAHRKHLYQLLANELKLPHLLVSSIYAFVQLFIGLGLIFFNNNSLLYAIVVILIMCVVYFYLKKKYFYLHLNN